MNKEELEKEAEEWIGRNKPVQDDWEDSDIIQAIVDTNEKREKRIEELEAQIEKMKCCGNCENRYEQEECKDCHNYSKWKFKQAGQFYEEIVE